MIFPQLTVFMSGQAGDTTAKNRASVCVFSSLRRLNAPGSLFVIRLGKEWGETGGGGIIPLLTLTCSQAALKKDVNLSTDEIPAY